MGFSQIASHGLIQSERVSRKLQLVELCEGLVLDLDAAYSLPWRRWRSMMLNAAADCLSHLQPPPSYYCFVHKKYQSTWNPAVHEYDLQFVGLSWRTSLILLMDETQNRPRLYRLNKSHEGKLQQWNSWVVELVWRSEHVQTRIRIVVPLSSIKYSVFYWCSSLFDAFWSLSWFQCGLYPIPILLG